MPDFCIDHSQCLERIERLESQQNIQWKKIEGIATKLNLILGGIVVSPFIVSVLVLLAKSNGN